MFTVRLRNCVKLEISCSYLFIQEEQKKKKLMQFKICFHLYMHNRCVAFNTSVVIRDVFVFYPNQNEPGAHHMHCCTDLKTIFFRSALISLS